MSLSTITNSTIEAGAKKMAVGPSGGVVIHSKLTDIFAVQAEVLFSGKGISAKLKANGIKERGTLRLYYLDIPLLLRAYIGNDDFDVFAGTGPQFGLGLFVQNAIRISGDHFRSRTTETSKFSPETRRFEMAWDFEVGIRRSIGSSDEIELSVRPVISLISIAKEDFKVVENRNFMLLMSVAYLFGK